MDKEREDSVEVGDPEGYLLSSNPAYRLKEGWTKERPEEER